VHDASADTNSLFDENDHFNGLSVESTTLYSDPVEKDLELFHPDQYYLYTKSPASSSSSSSSGSKERVTDNIKEADEKEISAYVALRRCREDTKESLESGDEASQIDVVYM
jgi:hypothetical protein